MSNKEQLFMELEPLINENLIRKTLDAGSFEIYTACENIHIVFMPGDIHKETGKNIFILLSPAESEILFKNPTFETLQKIVLAADAKGENKCCVFTDDVIEKFRIVREKVKTNPKAQINRNVEAKLVEKAEKFLKKHNVEYSSPGMGGR